MSNITSNVFAETNTNDKLLEWQKSIVKIYCFLTYNFCFVSREDQIFVYNRTLIKSSLLFNLKYIFDTSQESKKIIISTNNVK